MFSFMTGRQQFKLKREKGVLPKAFTANQTTYLLNKNDFSLGLLPVGLSGIVVEMG